MRKRARQGRKGSGDGLLMLLMFLDLRVHLGALSGEL